MNQRGLATSQEPAEATDPRVRYGLEVLLGQDAAAEAPVVYGDAVAPAAAEAVVHVIPSGFFADTYGTAGSLPKLPLKEVEGVPLLFDLQWGP